MLSGSRILQVTIVVAFVAFAFVPGFGVKHSDGQQLSITGPEAHGTFRWVGEARERRGALWTGVRGTLTLDDGGVSFRRDQGRAQRWSWEDIHTASLGPHKLLLATYRNRSLHRPGEQHFEFELSGTLPPVVAAEFAARLGRPVRNADPDGAAPALAVLPVRHRGLMRGTNGILRVRRGGMDYVTPAKGDSRSWRWADIQAVSEPDPYHLYVFGYRDTYTFDLKAPLSRKLFDYATDEIYRAAEAGGER